MNAPADRTERQARFDAVSGCDPFYEWTREKIKRLRDECLNHADGEHFYFDGVCFVMPIALYRSNARLMSNAQNDGCSSVDSLVEDKEEK